MADNDKKYVPQLRFPEFVNDGEWVYDTMQNIFDIKNGYTPSKANPAFWENGTIPWFRMEDIRKNGHILSDSIQHVTPVAVKGAGLFPAYSIIVATTATIGEHALIIVDSLANQQFTFLIKRKSFNDKLDMLYFHYYMFVIDEWCKRNTNIGGLLSVNMDRFKNLSIPYPRDLSEQRKIAECLSSLDGYIDALKNKLEQLKEHKRGMMQKLFPAKGKTVPEIRFPEFRDDGEWSILNLADIIHTITPSKKLKSSEYKNKGKYPIIDQSQNYIAGYSDDSSALLNTDNKTCVIFGDHTCVLKSVDFPFIQGADGIKIFYSDSPCITTAYLYVYLSAHPIVSKEYKRHFLELKEIDVLYPANKKEQDKISESFTSIDEVIDRCINKINTLELFKSGLIRQLFPKL